jgi:COP9 signalosome complex subunit 3
MESVFANLEKDEKQQISNLKKNIRALNQKYQNKDPLELLDPAKHTCAYLFILNARLHSDSNNITFLQRFVSSFVYSGALKEEFQLLMTWLSKQPLDLAQPFMVQLAITASKQKCLVIQVPALIASIQLKRIDQGLLIIKEPIEEFHCDVKQFLLYYYYGGMVYLASKQYENAIEFFTTTLYVPTMNPSHVQLEAYKKLLFSSFIQSGKTVSIPSHIPMAVSKMISSAAQVYSNLVEYLESFQFQKVQEQMELESVKQTLVADGNFGLFKQCLIAMVRYHIIQLTKTYLTLSLVDMERLLGPIAISFMKSKTLEDILIEMIAEQVIYAKIADGMVYFKDDPNKYDTVEFGTLLEKQVKSIGGMSGLLTKIDREIATSAAYQSQIRRPALDSSKSQ